MSAVGNDNYRPDMIPPEPIRPATGWLSGNMAQLMVFLNGLILTITAFATLSVFINEIIQEGLFKTTIEVQEHIFNGYADAQYSLESLAAVIEMSDGVSEDNFKNYVHARNSSVNYYEQIFWIQRADNRWKAVPLLDNPSFVNSFGSPNKVTTYILKLVAQNQGDSFMATSVPMAAQGVKQMNEQGRTFAFVKKLGGLSDLQGYLVGFSNLSAIVDHTWLDSIESVLGIQVIDTKMDLPIFSYQKSASEKSGVKTQYTNIFSNQFAGKELDIKVDLGIGARESFLQKIPFLMLLFGVTLTLIGTLYVRNNQSQSKKLSNMNKELAHKNFELHQEMSERERLNQVIQKSAREHRSIINAVSDIIFEASVDGRLLFLNESWSQVTGFELERSLGRSLFDLIYVQDQEEQRHNFEQLIRGNKQSYRVFTRLRSADGSFRAVELAVSMVRQDENNETRVVGTITDVEERRRAERALSEAEKKYRAIVENAAGGIYQVTPDGQFLSANPAYAKITGYDTPEEVLRDISNANEKLYVDKELRERFLGDISILDAPKNFEGQIIRKDGEKIWVSENVRPVKDDEGTLLFYEGSMEDIDQRRKAEIALKDAMTQSDLANRAKSEFLANMSHELRTPLNAVIGFAEIIKNEAFGPLPKKEYKEYASSIYESGQGLLNVINEILDMSRIEAGERTLNEGVVVVKEVVDSALTLMDSKIKGGKIRVENKITDPAISFIGEKQALKQMMLNLISNAVKFSPPESLMLLDAELDNKGRLRISVTDTGKGLDESELEKAISAFGQLETDHSRSKSGTGLGLTLVKSLLELHGGDLELVSQKGIGTTATLIFPEERVTKPNKDEQKKEESTEEDISAIDEDTSGADVF